MRRLTHVDLLIIDDFALKAMDHTETADFYELTVEGHQNASTIVTSNRVRRCGRGRRRGPPSLEQCRAGHRADQVAGPAGA